MSDNKAPNTAQEFLQQAYAAADQADQLGFYKKWANVYDNQMVDGLDYISPVKIAQTLARYCTQKAVSVLDIGCGTGLTAAALIHLGYTTIDGLDYSAEMLDVAREKSIYRRVYMADLNGPLDIENEAYGAVISSGTFTHGHVGPAPLDELMRVLKPAGYLACTVHQDLWCKAGFKAKFKALEASAQLKQLKRAKGQFFKGGAREGWFCLFQKC